MEINGDCYQRPFKLTMQLQRERSNSVNNDAFSVILSKNMATKLLKSLNLPDELIQAIVNRGVL